eukprot:gene9304-12535_t
MNSGAAFTFIPPKESTIGLEDFPNDDAPRSVEQDEKLRQYKEEISGEFMKTQDELRRLGAGTNTLPFNRIIHMHESTFTGENSEEFNAQTMSSIELHTSFLSKEWTKLQRAYLHWVMIGPRGTLTDLQMMEYYETLYISMTENNTDWEEYWKDNRHYMWSERSIGVINTYATVLRQRAEKLQANSKSNPGDVQENIRKAERVLNLGGQLLIIHKRMVYATDNGIGTEVERDASVDCLKGLTYKYLLIKHNLLNQTNRMQYTSMSELRFMICHEIDTYIVTGSREEYGYRCLTVCFELGFTRPRDINHALIAKLSNKQLKAAYLAPLNDSIKSDPWIDMTHMCGNCGSFEPTLGEYKKCGQCRSEFYCSSECQKLAWKGHKILCVPIKNSA